MKLFKTYSEKEVALRTSSIVQSSVAVAKASPSRKNQQRRVESPAEKQKRTARSFYEKRHRK